MDEKIKENNGIPELKNDDLIAAMNALKQKEDPQTQAKFVAEAVKSMFFSPADLLDADGKPIEKTGKVKLSEDAKFNFRVITNAEGENYFMVFTGIDEFQKWNKEEKIRTVVVGFPQMANLVLRNQEAVNGFVINPLGQNLIFRKELLAEMAKRAMEAQAQAQDGETRSVQLMLGKPVNIPDSVLDSFRKTLARNKDIKAVYFVMMKQDNKEHYMFVFDTDLEKSEAKKAADSFCASARLFLSKFPVISAPLDSVIGEKVPEITEPFYTRA